MKRIFIQSLIACALVGISVNVASAANLILAHIQSNDPTHRTWVRNFVSSEELGLSKVKSVDVSRNEILGLLRSGSVDLAILPIRQLDRLDADRQNIFTIAPVFAQPFQFPDTRQLFDIQKTGFGRLAMADINKSGLIPITFVNRGQTNIVVRRSIRTADDFKGLKLISPRQSTGGEVLSALGAAPTFLPVGEVPLAVERGAVDGAALPLFNALQAGNFIGSGGSVIRNYQPLVSVLLANNLAWDKLTVLEKRALVKAAQETTEIGNQEILAREALLELSAIERKLLLTNFNTKDREELMRASQKVWARKTKGDTEVLDDLTVIQENLRKVPTTDKPTRSLKSAKTSTQPLLFMTDRRDDGGDFETRFGSIEPAATLKCGVVGYTTIKKRSVGKPYKGVIRLKSGALVTDLSACIAGLTDILQEAASNRVLIYIHGFNNSFEEAIRRGVRLLEDAEYQGPVIVWSWPSEGEVVAYGKDADTIRGTTRRFARNFVKELMKSDEVNKIDFIAHSMGARLGLELMEMLSDGGQYPTKLGNFIFAAPDESDINFKGTLNAATNYVGPKTLYATECDVPLAFSAKLHKQQRAGTGGYDKIILNKHIQSIDVSKLELNCFWRNFAVVNAFSLSHSYVFDVPEVIADMKQVFKTGHNLTDRSLTKKKRDNAFFYMVNEFD
jgi:esterase/lipase superfamily enzyme/TRAP-type C4-dicarboxylate transport system substrate-binding protein